MTLAGFPSTITNAIARSWWRLTRGQTLGVRTVVFNDAGDVLLIRHRYAAGWHFPGGGVEPAETLEQPAVRELAEETGIIALGRPRFVAPYANFTCFPRDHVALFLIDEWRQCAPARPRSLEIAETGFFPRDRLPEATATGVVRRLAELKSGAQPDTMW